MSAITKPVARRIVEDFAEEIRLRKTKTVKPSTAVINFRTEIRDGVEREVFRVPIELLRFRKDNGRIASDIMDHERNIGILDEKDEKAQAKIADFLEQKDPEKTAALKMSIMHDGQRDPAISRENREARVNRWYNLPERLEHVVERLRSVRVEKRDARELLSMFADRPATLVYLDPPYFVKRDHGYAIDAKDREFHVELLEICVKAKCMLLVSGYETELYQKTLTRKKGWKKAEIETHTRDTSGRDYAKTEVLWMNGQFLKAQTTGKVPIRLSRKESAEKKINPQR